MVQLFLALILASTTPIANSDEAILRNLKQELWPKAYQEQNVELLDQILHDSFQMIDDAGKRFTKQQELDWVRDNRMEVEKFEYEIQRLEIYQDRFAVVAGRGTTESYSYVSSNYLVKEDGRWRAIASHVSGVASFENEAQDTPGD